MGEEEAEIKGCTAKTNCLSFAMEYWVLSQIQSSPFLSSNRLCENTGIHK